MDNIKYLKRKFPISYERILLHLTKELIFSIKEWYKVFEIIDDKYWRFTEFRKWDIWIYKNVISTDCWEDDIPFMRVWEWEKRCFILHKNELSFFTLINSESIKQITI